MIALTEEDKKEERLVRELADKQAVRGWLKGFPQELFFVRRVFTHKDGSIGLLNLGQQFGVRWRTGLSNLPKMVES